MQSEPDAQGEFTPNELETPWTTPGLPASVVVSFRLTGRKVKFIFDEHETQILGHSRTLEAILGSRLVRTKG